MKARLLIVGDETKRALALRRQLRRMDCRVLGTVSSAAEAIEQARRERPDLVLMNISLEGDIDAIEAARRISARMRIPVVLIHSHADQEPPRRTAHAGSDKDRSDPPKHFPGLQAVLQLASPSKTPGNVQDGPGDYRADLESPVQVPPQLPPVAAGREQPSILESSLCESLDQLTLGFMLLNRHQEVSFANRSAMQTLEHCPRLLLDNGHLRCTVEQTAEKMEWLLRRRECGLLSLPREQHALRLLLLPLYSTWSLGTDAARFALYLFDVTEQAHLMSAKFRTPYGLSDAESQLVKVLLEQPDLAGAAKRLFVSESTARTHLKRVLSKTGHHKQVAFLHHTLTDPAWSILDFPQLADKQRR